MNRSRRTTAAAAVLAFALAVPLAACSSSGDGGGDGGGASGSTSSPATPAKATDSVTIKGFKFTPTPATAKVGDTLTIRNEDGSTHTFTSSDGPAPFDTGDIPSGETATVELTEKGTYAYECSIHDQMKGEITVD